MPTDKQIWAEVDEQLARFPESFKLINRVPERQALFDQKKAWYLDEPKRQATADAALEKANKAKAMQVTVLNLKRVGSGAKIDIEDGNGKVLSWQAVDYTDFPLQSITLYAQWAGEHWVGMLPSEY